MSGARTGDQWSAELPMCTAGSRLTPNQLQVKQSTTRRNVVWIWSYSCCQPTIQLRCVLVVRLRLHMEICLRMPCRYTGKRMHKNDCIPDARSMLPRGCNGDWTTPRLRFWGTIWKSLKPGGYVHCLFRSFLNLRYGVSMQLVLLCFFENGYPKWNIS